jgi:DeoR family glycerol-3-phosphate regulon repressor
MESFRKSQILELARHEGEVTVDALASRFNVTTQTIRRDLGDLAEAGQLQRVHGGAIMPASHRNPGYRDRKVMNEAEKRGIARLCARQIPANSSILLNIGTSTEAVARELLEHQNLTVITNNINVAEILTANESCKIIVAGGILRREDGGLVGDLTTEVIRQFKVDYAIIGTSALDLDGNLLEYDLQEVRVSRTIIECSSRTFLVVDRSKLERSAPVRIASLEDLDAVFTDGFPEDLRRKCDAWNTAVFTTDGRDDGIPDPRHWEGSGE